MTTFYYFFMVLPQKSPSVSAVNNEYFCVSYTSDNGKYLNIS
jgi:hypothetical protein